MEKSESERPRRELRNQSVRTGVILGLELILALLALVLLLVSGGGWLPAGILLAAAAAVMTATGIYLHRATEKLLHNYLELDRSAKNWMLIRLLEGEHLPSETLEQVFLEVPLQFFVVIQVGIVDAGDLTDAEEKNLFYEEDEYLRGIFKTTLDRKGVTYFIPLAGTLCIIGCIPEPESSEAAEEAAASLCELTAGCIDRIREETGLILGAVASTVHEGPDQLQAAWQEANELTAYAELMGDKAVVKNAYQDLDAPPTLQQRKERMDLEKQYVAQIAARDYRRAGQILEQLLEAEVPMASHNPELLKNRLVMRLEQMLDSLCISLDDYDAAAAPVVERFKAMIVAQTIEELRQGVAGVAEAAAGFAEHAARSNSGRVTEALEFIRDNYADPNMGAALLSEQLGLSASYLSRIIKQATGVGIVDCIHTERIRAAKKLLTETGLSIDEIAEKIGFSNRWTFTRSFKRYEGTTPGAYRESQRSA